MPESSTCQQWQIGPEYPEYEEVSGAEHCSERT